MGAALVALLLAQDLPDDLFGGDDTPPADQPPPVRPPPDDGPLVVPPADGPVPDGVPKGEDPPPLKPPSVRGRDEYRAMITGERQHLLDTMPRYVGPATLAALGGVGFVFGGAFAALGAPSALSGRIDPSFAIGVPIGLIGLGGLVFGLMWVRERSLEREPFWERIHQIEMELGW